eukprot:5063258-Prymnesium_polylepis.1
MQQPRAKFTALLTHRPGKRALGTIRGSSTSNDSCRSPAVSATTVASEDPKPVPRGSADVSGDMICDVTAVQA